MKNQVFAVSLLMAASGLQGANASLAAPDGTISFTGAITAETCSVAVTGATMSGGNFTINLPMVSSNTLIAGGSTKGATAMNFQLTGCAGGSGTAVTSVGVYFEAGAGVAVDGSLLNSATSSASNVHLQINDQSGNKVTPGMSQALTPIVSGGATIPYSVQYVSQGATTTPGAYQGQVTYSLAYQ